MAKIILLVTSEANLGSTGKKTGWYLPEVAHPFQLFNAKGYDITFASPKGGLAPADPNGVKDFANDEVCKKFRKEHLNENDELKTVKMSTLKAKDYDVIFYAGGHGTMYDFPNDDVNNAAAQSIFENGGIVSAVCHGPAGLCNIKLSNGEYLVKGKKVTGFTDDEERTVKLDKVMPFMLEATLKERGALFVGADTFAENVVVDGRLVTGQNPASASKCANEIIKILDDREIIETKDDDDTKNDTSVSKVNVILLVSSHADLGNTGKKTGWYLPEVAHPYEHFDKQKYNIVFASPKGGYAPADPGGIKDWENDEVCTKFKKKWLNENNQLNTLKMSTLKPEEYDVLFYCGGHGTMYDFYEDDVLNNAAKIIYENGGIIVAVCHGPAGICNIKLSNGEYLVKGKQVTGFTDDEERAMKLTEVMPFLLETTLKKRGAQFVGKKNWQENCVVDSRLVTGQNPKSANACAIETIKLINKGCTQADVRKRVNLYCHDYADSVKEILLDPIEIQKKVKQLGKEITKYYHDLNDNVPLLVVGLLRGAFVFISDISREIKCKHAIDFMMVKSYAGTKSSNVKILLDMNIDPEGKHVLIVEDLVDTGKTLMWLEKHLKMKKAVSVKKCVLLKKKTKRLHKNFNKEVILDFVGFNIEDHWICGYGMDYNQHYRSLPCIVILKEETYTTQDKKHLGIQ